MPETTQKIPQPGNAAPDFTAASTSGREVKLSEFKGKQPILLAFFPLAFTGVCSQEMKCFEDDFDKFSEKGVEILPISVDSVPTLKEFKSKIGMRTDLLSDFKRDVSRAYGVLMPDKFHSRRAYFLIDKSGVVRWTHVEEQNGLRRENSEILAEVEKLGKA